MENILVESAFEDVKGMIEAGQLSREKLAALVHDLEESLKKKEKKEKKAVVSMPRPVQDTVLRYTTIERRYTCSHCGTVHSKFTQLTRNKDEYPVVLTTEGVKILTSKDPALIECECNFCEYCAAFVRALPRNELEDKYIEMLRFNHFYKQRKAQMEGIV